MPGLFSLEFWQETFALTRRWFIQLKRRPTTFLVGVIQPLLWLLLFGSLFQNAPQGLFGETTSYMQFLGAGVIVFTAYGGALNAGVPVLFDREFGFLNRLLVAPLASRFSIVLASAFFIVSMALVQTGVIVGASYVLGAGIPNTVGLAIMTAIVSLLVLGFTALSLGLAFAMPGHAELLALIFLINLPLIFSSTALAPLSFMPAWLKWVASLNPLTHAIEPIRYIYTHSDWAWSSIVLNAPWGGLSLAGSLVALLVFVGISVKLVQGSLSKVLA
ncbi:ABC transporter permease [Synechococcus sp. PCC 7336]|uniref:ABC transporter permease n=1 Tax=Synechococcus sp. PCC 7336 TaxID=195250 RepID=UPI00156737E0|nr:ABC transporter permease [Synechococcus sp. PCC 7336]